MGDMVYTDKFGEKIREGIEGSTNSFFKVILFVFNTFW